jgi:hypothetical protein
MGQTLRIANGQLDLNPNTGLLNTVEGNRKCSQDLAECILQTYDPIINYGSFLTEVVTNSTAVPHAGDLFIRHYIAQAVQLLKSKQLEDPTSTATERIVNISQLITQFDDATSTVAFYLSVDTETAEADAAIVNIPRLVQPTELEQLYEDIK